MKTFGEKERRCQATFAGSGPYWHAFTNGNDSPIIFVNDDGMRFAMNVIAQTAFVLKDKLTVIAFEVMNNHLHFSLAGAEDDIIDFFRFLRRRLCTSIPDAKHLTPFLKQIKDLNTFRNNIVYVNRNGFVASPDYTPFSYPWGTGRYYFNHYPSDCTLGNLFVPALRKMVNGVIPRCPSILFLCQ